MALNVFAERFHFSLQIRQPPCVALVQFFHPRGELLRYSLNLTMNAGNNRREPLVLNNQHLDFDFGEPCITGQHLLI